MCSLLNYYILLLLLYINSKFYAFSAIDKKVTSISCVHILSVLFCHPYEVINIYEEKYKENCFSELIFYSKTE